MKKLAAMLFSMALTVPIPAAPIIHQGAYEARVEPIVDFNNIEGNANLPMRGTFGYYVAENLQFGGCVEFAKQKFESYWGKGDIWGLGVYGEFNLELDSPVLPYLGLSASVYNGHQRTDMPLVVSVSPGLKFDLSRYVTASIQVNWNVSNEEVYDFKRDLTAPDAIEKVYGDGKTSAFTGGIAIRFIFY